MAIFLIDPNKVPFMATCVACEKDVEISRILQEGKSKTYCLACGHSQGSIAKVVNETANINEDLPSYYVRTIKRKLRKLFRTKTSIKTKRRAREYLEIDRQRRLKIHWVEELNDAGEWERCHDEEVPFGPKDVESKPADPVKQPSLIVDTTEQLADGFGAIMFLDGGERPEDEEELDKGS